jgi:N,N'-diacetyllegionaminate synthase
MVENLTDFSKFFSDPSHTFVIAEAGSNWKVGSYDEDLKQASQLIKVAAQGNADAIKFQTYRSETVYVEDAGQVEYLNDSRNINEIFEYLSMPYKMIKELSELCKESNILFMSTPFSVEDAKQIDPYVQIHKIASYEINHVRLLEVIAKTKKPVLISTGASTYDQIDFVINLMKKNHSGPIGLFQCTSKYPAPIEDLNLLTIPKLKERYDVPVGLSDHSIEAITAPVMAMGLGATFIEKHFTLDKTLDGPDHAFALNPEELFDMVKIIRDADKTKGNGEKRILPIEEELFKFATRSIQATTNISKGDQLIEGNNFNVLRSGNRLRGLDARFLDQINGKKAKNNIKKGDGIIEYE